MIALSKKIVKLECPRDDSLDNAVIVWMSDAFSSTGSRVAPGDSTGGKKGSALTSVLGACNALEEAGLTVRRCATPTEAVAIVRELQDVGQLRCLVIGGDEKPNVCNSSCGKSHSGDGNCVVCDKGWGSHSGHNCPGGGGARGAWRDMTAPKTNSDALALVKSLVLPPAAAGSATSLPILPPSRIAIYSAHVFLKEEERLFYWRSGCGVIDKANSVLKWVASMPPLSNPLTLAQLDAMDVDERNREIYERIHKFDAENVGVVMNKLVTLPNSEIAAYFAPTFNLKAAIATIVAEPPSTPTEEEAAPVSPLAASLDRPWMESDRILVDKYRKEVDRLEEIKAKFSEDFESARRRVQAQAFEKNKALEESVSARISVLVRAEVELQQLWTALSRGDPMNKLEEEQRRQWVGGHNGRDAALALGWLQVHNGALRQPDSEASRSAEANKALCKHYVSVVNELAFLRQMALAAKVVAHVTSPIHKKLLNLCYNWITTYLPHCLAKVNRVSFGLLSAEDCLAALAADPHVPRSRLKLAVPFIGKDVPSKASEFAHPDVIIGLTILAYRQVILVRFLKMQFIVLLWADL